MQAQEQVPVLSVLLEPIQAQEQDLAQTVLQGHTLVLERLLVPLANLENIPIRERHHAHHAQLERIPVVQEQHHVLHAQEVDILALEHRHVISVLGEHIPLQIQVLVRAVLMVNTQAQEPVRAQHAVQVSTPSLELHHAALV